MELQKLRQFAVGDWVDIDDGIVGKIVMNAARGEWSNETPPKHYSSEEYQGIMIRQTNGALIFHGTDYFTEYAGRIRRVEEPD